MGGSRIAVVAGSPVYYQTPLYRVLEADYGVDITLFCASDVAARRPVDLGFAQDTIFDIDPTADLDVRYLSRAKKDIPTGSFFALRSVDIAREVLQGRYDAVWAHGYYYCTHLLAALAQFSLRRPVLFRDDQTLLNPRASWKRVAKRVLLSQLFSRAYCLYVGSNNYDWFRRWGARADRLFFVPNCVDNDRLQRRAAELAGAKQQLRIDLGVSNLESGPVILMAARLVAKKQPAFLLEAFARVRARVRCNLVFVGSGPEEASLRAMVERRAIPDVTFAGFKNQGEIPEAYAAADVFVLPSLVDETWGLVVNEAMNFGLPVVASDRVGAAADLVQPGRNGYVFAHDDVGELAAILHELVADAGWRKRLGAAGREIISTWDYHCAASGAAAALAAARARTNGDS